MIGSAIRRLAQRLRHSPALAQCEPLWRLLRRPYLWILNLFAARCGLEITMAGYPVRLHPRFATQNWETVEAISYETFVKNLQPNDIVFDIGAHIGTYTLLALHKVGSEGRIIAFEPHAVTRRYLDQHLAWAHAGHKVLVREQPCSNESGTCLFFYQAGEDQAEGQNGLVPVQGFQRRMVTTTTIDAEVSRLEIVPTFIKVDVEGAEWKVLLGAEETLERYHPKLLVSLHPPALGRQGVYVDDVLGWLQKRGYQYEILARDHEVHVFASEGRHAA